MAPPRGGVAPFPPPPPPPARVRVRALPPESSARLRAGAQVPSLGAAVGALVRNACEAGAARVRVTLEGPLWARVEDDGRGVAEADMALLGTRGATSKPVPGGGASGGTTGESLWAIAALSLLEVESRQRAAGTTWRKQLKGGATLISLSPAPRQRPAGTAVTLRDLFWNQPVRAKAAMARPRVQTEAARAACALLALAFPRVAVSVVDNTRRGTSAGGKTVLHTRGVGQTPLEVAVACLGAAARGMAPCGGASASARVRGLVALPAAAAVATAKPAAQLVFVNRRAVRGDSAVHRTANALWARAMAALAPVARSDRRAPPASRAAYVLHVECAPDAVALSADFDEATADFADEADVVSAVRGALQAAWRHALPEEKHARALAAHSPRRVLMIAGRSDEQKTLRALAAEGARPQAAPPPPPPPPPPAELLAPRTASFALASSSRAPKRPRLPAADGAAGHGSGLTLGSWRRRKGFGFAAAGKPRAGPGAADAHAHASAPLSSSRAALLKEVPTARWTLAALTAGDDSTDAPTAGLFLPAATSQRVASTGEACASAAAPGTISRAALQGARALAQVERKFVLAVSRAATGDNGTLLLAADQHAADERVRVEALRAMVVAREGAALPARGAAACEPLASPLPVALSEAQRYALERHAAHVRAWGWRWRGDEGTPAAAAAAVSNGLPRQELLFDGFPMVLGALLTAGDLVEWLGVLLGTGGAATCPPPAVVRLLASRACRSALMFGDALTTSDAQRLLDALKGTRLAFQCAHGRPTVAPLADLDAMAHQHAEDERAAIKARPRLTLGRMRARCAASRC